MIKGGEEIYYFSLYILYIMTNTHRCMYGISV